MTVLFYRRQAQSSPDEPPGLPAGLELRSWRPAKDGPPRQGDHRSENLAWRCLQRSGLFATDDFEELTVWRAGRLVHRLVVTPRWLRFPFMAPEDLQLGALWTAPEIRRVGVARMVMAEAHRRHAAPGRWFWYVVEGGNAASIGLAEASGYRLLGAGRRTRPLGLRALGQYRLESVTIPPPLSVR